MSNQPMFSKLLVTGLVATSTLGLSACTEAVELEAREYVSDDETSDADDQDLQLSAADNSTALAKADVSTYYRVTRQDFRKCIFPLCGGVFVERVNKAQTKCADGTKAAECYVAVADLSALGLDANTEADARAGWKAGEVLLRGGDLQNLVDPSIAYPIATLEATEAWRGVTGNAPDGKFWRASDSGIVCFTYPCVSIDLAKLNTKRERSVAGIDFVTGTGASNEQVATGQSGLVNDELIVAGSFFKVTGPAGKAKSLEAAEFYTPIVASSGCNSSDECGEGDYCATEAGACGSEGTCVATPDVCLAVVIPVCGCDGVTYSNASCASLSGMSVAYDGPCDTTGQSCKDDADCGENGWCGWADNNSDRVCKAWATEGESCEGFVLPSYRARCGPNLECEFSEPTFDVPGTCVPV